jgi:hypothetical protein
VNGANETPLVVNSGANNGDWVGDSTTIDLETIGALGRSSVMSFLEGRIMEMGRFDVAISDAEIAALSAALNAKYAVY